MSSSRQSGQGEAGGFQFSVRVDAARNVVYLTQAGSAEKADMLRMREAYVRALQQVRPGFVLVNDQRGVLAFSAEALEAGAELVALTGQRGVGRVVRLRPEAPAMRVRITRALIAGRASYISDFADSLEEAERLIEAYLATVPR